MINSSISLTRKIVLPPISIFIDHFITFTFLLARYYRYDVTKETRIYLYANKIRRVSVWLFESAEEYFQERNKTWNESAMFRWPGENNRKQWQNGRILETTEIEELRNLRAGSNVYIYVRCVAFLFFLPTFSFTPITIGNAFLSKP